MIVLIWIGQHPVLYVTTLLTVSITIGATITECCRHIFGKTQTFEEYLEGQDEAV